MKFARWIPALVLLFLASYSIICHCQSVNIPGVGNCIDFYSTGLCPLGLQDCDQHCTEDLLLIAGFCGKPKGSDDFQCFCCTMMEQMTK